MSHMPEPLSNRQNFLPSAERLGSTTDMQSFAHHVQTLYQLEVPNENIYLALSTDLPVSNLIETFHAAAKKIDLWLEYANVAIFALELDVKEGMSVKNVSEMDVLIHKFAPNVDLLQELSQTVLDNLKQPTDEERHKDIKNTLDRIHTDWVDVKAFFGRVKKEMSESKQRRELMETMDQILASIEELNTNIFEYQEQRHSGLTGSDGEFPFPKLSSSPTSRSRPMTPAASSSFNSNTHNEFSSRADVALMKLDSRLEPLSARIEYLRSRLSAPNAPSDPNGALAKKNNILTNKWEALKHEMDSLREECKEDRWLGVFKQVTGNATQMMDSLERAVKQCKDFIIRATSRSDSPLKLFQQNRGMSIPSRHNQKYQQQQSQQQFIAITPKNFQRLYKNFEAKRKYYVPTVTKMLTMLGNGINNQMTRDWDAIKKYKAMKERWDIILDGVTEVQREMPTLESLLDASLLSSNSPPSSIPSSIASSPPMSPNMRPSKGESGSPPKGQRALSPYRRVMSPSEYERSLSPPRNNARSPSLRSKSPSPRATSPGGGRSYLTPNGGSVSPPPLSDRHPWGSQYNHSSYNSPYHSPYGPSYNNNDHGNSYYRERASSPQPRNGRSKSSTRSESPIRSPTTGRPMTPGDRMHPSAIPRPVTSMGLASRSTSRAGMRPFLPQPSTPQPGMTASLSRLSMVSPPPKRQPLRSPTPSSVTSSLSRPITPEADDRPMTPLTETLSKMAIEYQSPRYIPLKNDPLDAEVAKVVNSSPLSVKVERAGSDKYYFGNEGGGRDRKIYLCRLMNYASSKKVMVRVGGGWKDLDMFLLDYSLMSRD